MKALNRALNELKGNSDNHKVSGQGQVGYDNNRENIDPRIVTKSIITKDISGSRLIACQNLVAQNTLTVSGSSLVVKDGCVGVGRIPDLTYTLEIYSPNQAIKVYNGSTDVFKFNNTGCFFWKNLIPVSGEVHIQTTSSVDMGVFNQTTKNFGVGTATFPPTRLFVSGGALGINNSDAAGIYTTISTAGQLFVSGGALFYKGVNGTLTVLGVT